MRVFYHFIIFILFEIKVEMQSEALLKEHEVRRRDLLILKYDKQRTLCDEIIQRQRALIEGTFSKLDYKF